METKVVKGNETTMPAGILNGTEAFFHENEKWVIHNGQTMKFSEAPGTVQRTIANAFMNDISSRAYLKKIGVQAFSVAFDMWYKCIIGAIDSTPDFVDDTFTPDAYNNACTDMRCPHRGRFCSCGPGLKNYEVETIRALMHGETIENTAIRLHISLPGLKSRIEKIKEKLEAKNMASLIARAAAYGILR